MPAIRRRRAIFKGSNQYSFNVTMTKVDVRRSLLKAGTSLYQMGMDELTLDMNKYDVLSNLSSMSADLGNWVGGEYMRELAEWAFRVALSCGYITETEDKKYSFSEELRTACDRESSKTQCLI